MSTLTLWRVCAVSHSANNEQVISKHDLFSKQYSTPSFHWFRFTKALNCVWPGYGSDGAPRFVAVQVASRQHCLPGCRMCCRLQRWRVWRDCDDCREFTLSARCWAFRYWSLNRNLWVVFSKHVILSVAMSMMDDAFTVWICKTCSHPSIRRLT